MALTSFCGVLPDPIAFFRVDSAVFGEQDFPAIIVSIPADGVEDEQPIGSAMIVQRLAVDDVVRYLRD